MAPHEDGPDQSTVHPPRRRGVIARIRANFLTGLVVVAPVGLTLWLVWTVTGWIDSWVWPFIPGAYRPDALIRFYFCDLTDPTNLPFYCQPDAIHLRGIGVVVFLIFTVFVGWIAKGIMGRSLISWGERPRRPDAGGPLDLQRRQAGRRDRLQPDGSEVRQGLPDRISAPRHLGNRLRLHDRERRGSRRSSRTTR